jgi:TPR repeat protein
LEGAPVGPKMDGIVRSIELACVVLLAGVGSALAQMSEQDARQHAEKFSDQVVRVIPKRTDGAPAPAGFGLVVGERAGQVYIATPYHVAFGSDRPSSLGPTPGIVFRSDRYNTIQARRIDVASPQDDLAVIEVTPPQGLALPRAPLVLASQLRPATFVWNIGLGQEWVMPDRAGGLGPQDVVTRLRRIGQLRTPPGASGGAGVTDSGVIGIVLQDATDYSLLLPVERIVELFSAWALPVNLLTPLAPEELARLYKFAADQGNAEAQVSLALMYENGRGVEMNDKEAARLYKLAADQGNATAQANLGVYFRDGRGGLRTSDQEAARLFNLASNQGNQFGQINLGLFYEFGRAGLLKNDEEAARLYKLAADKGNGLARVNLALMYELGRGVEKDDEKAARLYKLAADKGNGLAQANLGLMYENGRGVSKNDQEAARLYKLAAEQGNATAQANLGLMYENGRVVEKDDEEAARGRVVEKDDEEAARLYKLAAEQGNATAQANLGVFFLDGRGGLPKNDQEAARLFKLAADQGNATAQANLGVFFRDGRGGLPKNDQEAAPLFKLAADQGNALGLTNLGLFYEYGRGDLPKNSQEATRLYGLAAVQQKADLTAQIINILNTRADQILARLMSYSAAAWGVYMSRDPGVSFGQKPIVCGDPAIPPNALDIWNLCDQARKLEHDISKIEEDFADAHKQHVSALTSGRLPEAKEFSKQALQVLSGLKKLSQDRNNRLTYRGRVVLDARELLAEGLPQYLPDSYPSLYADQQIAKPAVVQKPKR